MVSENQLTKLPDSEIDCLRCEKRMKDAGKMQFHEGARWGLLGPAGELMVNRMELEVYICPACGKTEFFF